MALLLAILSYSVAFKLAFDKTADNPGTVKQKFAYSSPNGAEKDVMTCCTWLETQQNQFAIGNVNSDVVFFDIVEDAVSNVA